MDYVYQKGNLMRNSDARKFILRKYEDVFRDLRNDYGFSLEHDDSMSVQNGVTRGSLSNTISNGLSSVVIGLEEFSKNPNYPVDSFHLVSALVAIYHEKSHVDRYISYYNNNDPVTKAMALSYMSCTGNSGYRGQRYWSDPCEISAQLDGILGAYDVLCDMFGNEKANKLICNYQNIRLSAGYDYVVPSNDKFPYQSIRDILDDFDTTFRDSLHKQRIYDIFADNSKKDVAANKFSGSAGSKYYDIFLKEPDGVRQDIMVTSICFGSSRGLPVVKYAMKSVAHVDFSLGKAFENVGVFGRMRENLESKSEKAELDRLQKERIARVEARFGTKFDSGSGSDYDITFGS